jgi:predicted metal-dependent HD superfamily phosphohydrolase
MNATLLTEIEEYVTRYYAEHPRPELLYHTLAHTQEVVQATEKLASHYQLSEADYLTIMAAAWFHDVGYLTSPTQNHEGVSADIATNYLQQLAAPGSIRDEVARCILATRMPQAPSNRLEEILCDADLFHLGDETYAQKQKSLRKERELLTGQVIKGNDWRQQNITLLENHRYFTHYAQTIRQQGQADNLQKLRDKQVEKEAKPAPDPVVAAMSTDSARQSDKEKSKDKKPERGIETMFRTTSTNHLRLSEIADSKANILISVNSIVISVLVSVLPRRIEENPALTIPTILFLVTSVLTIIVAILATRPVVTEGRFTREDIEQKRGNLLFFGNFFKMSLEEYEWGIEQLMSDSGYLYATMTRDIYYLGRVLGRKYRLLRVAYLLFMCGLIVSVLAFLVVFMFFTTKP